MRHFPFLARLAGILLLALLVCPMADAQEHPCVRMQAAADLVLREMQMALRENANLRLQLQEAEARLTNNRISFPPMRLPVLPPTARMYHDEFGRCGDLGRIKDLREYKRDSINCVNAYLDRLITDRLALAQPPAQGGRPSPPPPSVSAPVKAPTLLTAKRDVWQQISFAYCEIAPANVQHIRCNTHQAQGVNAFDVLIRQAGSMGKTLQFAMNAGIFGANRHALGLLIVDRKPVQPLNTQGGSGNFYLQPNGVFYVDQAFRAHIISTTAFAALQPPPYLVQATQSGPMLIDQDKINTIFTQKSTNLHIRNAVGVKKDGTVIFTISEQPVSFYDLASFLHQLGCENALYLDGGVSRMYCPSLKLSQSQWDSKNLGPVIYLME